MPITTRLTRRLGIRHPVISAPMAFAAGGALAAAVSNAGGLGLIGGGYGDRDWLEAQFRAAGNARVGCGFITWSAERSPEIVDRVLEQDPAALFLSFGDPERLARKAKDKGTTLICQVQTLEDSRRALDCGADIIVAQGSEAGGHGEKRATLTLVPEIADMLAKASPETLLCAAGGIGDGRSIAASLMLGADGVLVGSRFWATNEALVHPAMHRAALAASGDQTIRSSVMDIVRSREWPNRFTARVLRNRFTEEWHGREAALAEATPRLAPLWANAWENGDTDLANVFIGETVGIIDTVEPAAMVLEKMIAEAEELLAGAPRMVTPD